MPDRLFRAYRYQPDRAKPPAYFIESSAADNIDATHVDPPAVPGLDPIADPDDAIKEIAGHLATSRNLVIAVHGFNNPRDAVLRRYKAGFDTILGDYPNFASQPICVGYRWPSEAMAAKAVLRTWWRAAPMILTGIFVLALISLGASVIVHYGLQCPLLWRALAIFGWVCLATPIAAFVLRIVVYFRDTYRATNYGAPDLVEIIRQIDTHMVGLDAQLPESVPGGVALSFLGHSMGAYVVTNAVRILSDVFLASSLRGGLNEGVVGHSTPATPGQATQASAQSAPLTFVSPEIGNVFRLSRLVLVSPDIPAETLISNRANYLASSLRRFKEAYLFSNGEDEVLRQISALANYFGFQPWAETTASGSAIPRSCRCRTHRVTLPGGPIRSRG